MEEEQDSLNPQERSLKDKVDEITQLVKELKGEDKKQNKIKISKIGGLGWMLGVIFAGLGFTLGWVLLDLSWGLIFGITAGAVNLIIFWMMNMFPPFTARRLGKRKKRLGYVVFINIGMNKAITFIKAQLDEGVAMVNGIPHVINPEDILIWKNKIPIVIQPEWSQRPLSTVNHYEETVKNQEESKGWKTLMNYIYKNQIKAEKKGIPTAMIVVGILIVLGLGYYAFKGSF